MRANKLAKGFILVITIALSSSLTYAKTIHAESLETCTLNTIKEKNLSEPLTVDDILFACSTELESTLAKVVPEARKAVLDQIRHTAQHILDEKSVNKH